MFELGPPRIEKTEDPHHPLFDLARKNLQTTTAAMLRGQFNVRREYEDYYRQLQNAFPHLYEGRQSDEAIRELPLILAICQKAPTGILLDNYFVAMPFNIETEETKRALRPGNGLVATMYGDIMEALQRGVLYTRFLNPSEVARLPCHFNPE